MEWHRLADIKVGKRVNFHGRPFVLTKINEIKGLIVEAEGESEVGVDDECAIWAKDFLKGCNFQVDRINEVIIFGYPLYPPDHPMYSLFLEHVCCGIGPDFQSDIFREKWRCFLIGVMAARNQLYEQEKI